MGAQRRHVDKNAITQLLRIVKGNRHLEEFSRGCGGYHAVPMLPGLQGHEHELHVLLSVDGLQIGTQPLGAQYDGQMQTLTHTPQHDQEELHDTLQQARLCPRRHANQRLLLEGIDLPRASLKMHTHAWLTHSLSWRRFPILSGMKSTRY